MLFCQTVKGSSSWTQNSKIIAASFVKCRIFRLLAIYGTRTRWYWYLCSGSAITESGSRSGILLNPDPDQGSFQDENSEFFSFFLGGGGMNVGLLGFSPGFPIRICWPDWILIRNTDSNLHENSYGGGNPIVQERWESGTRWTRSTYSRMSSSPYLGPSRI